MLHVLPTTFWLPKFLGLVWKTALYLKGSFCTRRRMFGEADRLLPPHKKDPITTKRIRHTITLIFELLDISSLLQKSPRNTGLLFTALLQKGPTKNRAVFQRRPRNLESLLNRTATHCNTLQHTATHCSNGDLAI